MKKSLAVGAVALVMLTAAAHAQDADAPGRMESVIVYGDNVYRDRSDAVSPTLAYDLQFFQRFEPTTVGEMLKRTPSVVFTSDVLEYDAVQLRGLGAQYTQVLINGRPVPGQSANGSFFVDRVPAELVERIEIVRSPSVDVTGEGVAGALNIVLKDGEDLEGAFVRAGGSYFADTDVRGAEDSAFSAAAALARSGPEYSFWLGADVQERKNPKHKTAEFFDADRVFAEESQFQADVRDGTDYSLNAGGSVQVGEGTLELGAYHILTEREENEHTSLFEGPRDAAELVGIETQLEDIEQASYGLDGLLRLPTGNGELEVSLAFSGFDEDTTELETEQELPDGDVESDEGTIDIEDRIVETSIAYNLNLRDGATNKTGIDLRFGEREGAQLGDTVDVEALIDSTRAALFTTFELDLGDTLAVEAGVRYEAYDRTVTFEGADTDFDGGEVLPALHAVLDVGDEGRVRASIARTVRYPDYDLITPFTEDETPGDDDELVGNPALELETAWGLDVGYERRVATRGIFGVNLFYRDIHDRIEIVAIAPFGDGSRYMPINAGDGQAFGVELDVSTPLDFIGLENTALYANYAWLDSEITDPSTGLDRKFSNQPDSVYNVSLVQSFVDADVSTGFSYQKRDEATAFGFDELVTTSYDGNLELFVEKRFNDRWVLRFNANNLLDAEKLEEVAVYDGDSGAELADAIAAGDVDEYETEVEESSPVYALTLRAAF